MGGVGFGVVLGLLGGVVGWWDGGMVAHKILETAQSQ